MEPQRFNRKVTSVEAIRYEGGEADLFAVADWINRDPMTMSANTERHHVYAMVDPSTYRLVIITITSGIQKSDYAEQGSWVVRSEAGLFFVRKNEEFENNYELAT